MRVSNHVARLGAGVVMAMMLATACGSPPASPSPPTATATPVITPDPHLTEPATADQIFGAIRVGDLPLLVNNATGGDPSSPIAKRINAAIGDWPLVITEYRTSALLRSTINWDPAGPLAIGSPPFTFVGLNIMIEFGPRTGVPTPPNANRQMQAEELVALVDPLLWPLEQRSVAPLPTKTAPPASVAPASSAP